MVLCNMTQYKTHTCIDGKISHEFSWLEYDAQNIPLCKVCHVCKSAKLLKYRPEILTGYTQADVDEPIESE